MPDVPPTTQPVQPPPPPAEPPPAAAAPPGAPPPTPEPPKPDPKEGAILAGIRARETKLVQRQQELAQQQRELERQRAAFQQEHARVQQHGQLAQQDPLRYLREAHGWSEEQIAARIMNGGKATPLEAQAKLERELSELRSWRDQQVQREQAQTKQQQIQAVRDAFVSTAKDDTRWPLASQVSAAKLIARGEAIAREHAAGGVSLSDEEILDKLEEEFGEIASIKSKVTTKQAAAQPSPKESTGGDTKNTAPPMTLTTANAGASSTPKVDTARMTKAELDEYTRKVLAEGRANGTIV